MSKKTTLTFGKKRRKDPSPTPAADLALLCGVITAAVFFLASLSPVRQSTGSPGTASDHAVPVMSGAVTEAPDAQDFTDVRELLRENVRHASGEPFGYMNGSWNLWEYLGDVMASLLAGG